MKLGKHRKIGKYSLLLINIAMYFMFWGSMLMFVIFFQKVLLKVFLV